MADESTANGPGILMPPYKVAFIIDGKVEDVIHTEARLAAIMLSNPLIVDATDQWPASGASLVGMNYDEATGTFSHTVIQS